MTDHPDWCVRMYCTATGYVGAHRSAPICVAAGPNPKITANLYAAAAAPQVTLVEFRCGATLLPPRLAYGLGRILVSLGDAPSNGVPS